MYECNSKATLRKDIKAVLYFTYKYFSQCIPPTRNEYISMCEDFRNAILSLKNEMKATVKEAVESSLKGALKEALNDAMGDAIRDVTSVSNDTLNATKNF